MTVVQWNLDITNLHTTDTLVNTLNTYYRGHSGIHGHLGIWIPIDNLKVMSAVNEWYPFEHEKINSTSIYRISLFTDPLFSPESPSSARDVFEKDEDNNRTTSVYRLGLISGFLREGESTLRTTNEKPNKKLHAVQTNIGCFFERHESLSGDLTVNRFFFIRCSFTAFTVVLVNRRQVQ